jgi:hypothetical protein
LGKSDFTLVTRVHPKVLAVKTSCPHSLILHCVIYRARYGIFLPPRGRVSEAGCNAAGEKEVTLQYELANLWLERVHVSEGSVWT